MKRFFPILLFFISKKLQHLYNQLICIYIYDSFLILFLPSMFSLSNQIVNLISVLQCFESKKSFSVCSNSKRMTTCVVKNPYILKAKSYISYYFFSLVSRLLPDILLGVLLFFFIIYFYLIDITYDYNKLLLI